MAAAASASSPRGRGRRASVLRLRARRAGGAVALAAGRRTLGGGGVRLQGLGQVQDGRSEGVGDEPAALGGQALAGVVGRCHDPPILAGPQRTDHSSTRPARSRSRKPWPELSTTASRPGVPGAPRGDRAAEVELVRRAGDGHVEEPLLLVEVALADRPAGGEGAGLHLEDEHHRPLEALGLVDARQRHPARAGPETSSSASTRSASWRSPRKASRSRARAAISASRARSPSRSRQFG